MAASATRSLLLLLGLVACQSGPAEPAVDVPLATLRNPVIPGFYPDPSLCRVGEDYYLVTSTFEYFPGVPVFHSRDLVNWRQIGHCLTRKSQLDLSEAGSSGGIYAPTLRYHTQRKRFYMVTTDVSTRGNFYVWADDPAGPWSEPIDVDQPGIDPDLFFEGDRAYFSSNAGEGDERRGCFTCEIDLDTGKKLTATRFSWSGLGGRYPEAPHLYKIGGVYYLMLAEGGTEYGHRVTIARSDSPYGPWEPCPRNPILCNSEVQDNKLQATGHADLFQDHNGNWWVVFLALRPVGYPRLHHTGRETCLAPVTWQDGWPIINGTTTVGLEVEGPRLPEKTWPEPVVREDFVGTSLGLEFNFRRNPIDENWSLTRKPGFLALRCRDQVLKDEILPTLVGRRQQHFAFRAATEVEFDPKSANEEAGLRVYMNDAYHYEVAIVLRGGKKGAILRRAVGSLIKEEGFVPLGDGPVELAVTAEARWYTFSVEQAGGDAVVLGKGESKFLSTQLARGFTGVYVGMYASGAGQASDNEARFDWFEYEPREGGR